VHHLLYEDGFNINSTTYKAEMASFEEQWQTQTWGDREGELWEVVGETWDVIEEVRRRWRAVAIEIYGVDWEYIENE